jgi:hypothetical protein
LANVFSGKILMAPLRRAVHFWWALLRRSRVAIILGTAFGSGFHRWCLQWPQIFVRLDGVPRVRKQHES